MRKPSEIAARTRLCPSPATLELAANDLIKLLEPDLGPRRDPRDEAALLLAVAAEIEHALMVQYLYAAYSVRTNQRDHTEQGRARGVAERLIQIAREEMGHLMTVQNLLHLIGAPLHFEREHSPFESQLYPFRFKLEPLSSGSLAKYVTAERPLKRPNGMEIDDWQRAVRIAQDAKSANDGEPVRHVGVIYERLIELFSDEVDGLQDRDFTTGNGDFQAQDEDWGYDLGLTPDESRRVHVDAFPSTIPHKSRAAAVEALNEIAEQGEGYGEHIDSHFERFYELYKDFCELEQDGVQFIWPVATNPRVLTSGGRSEASGDAGQTAMPDACDLECSIEADRSRNWAHLFNLRYRLLIGFLTHFLRITGRRYVPEGPGKGDRTPRGFLLLWAFDEMRHLKKLAAKLVRLPLRDPYDGVNAGPPFQMPYTRSLPDWDHSRWRTHLGAVRGSLALLQDALMAPGSIDECDPFLADLRAADERTEMVLGALAEGHEIPAEALPEKFKKVAVILEEAVRGFQVEAHGNFWSGLDRNAFVGLHMFNTSLIERDPENCDRLVADGSLLVSQIERTSKTGKMPRYRPPIVESRRRFIREWIEQGAPDGNPPDKVGVRSERDPNLD